VQASLIEFASFYESYDIDALRFSDSHCWAAFGPANGEYRRVAHQTTSISSDGLRVFVNVELKAATDRFKAVLNNSAQAIRTKLEDLHGFGAFEIVLQERVQRRASLYDYTPKMRLHSSLLADDAIGRVAWMAFVETVQRLPLPYLRIERLLAPQKLLQLPDGDQAVELVVEIFRQYHAVVELLNR